MSYYRLTVYCYSDLDEDDIEDITEFALTGSGVIAVSSVEVSHA